MRSLLVLTLTTLAVVVSGRVHHHHSKHAKPHHPIASASTDVTTTATVYLAGDQVATIKLGVEDPKGDAYGRYTESVESTGWGILDVVATSNSHDLDAAFAAGYLEGYLTAPRIYQMYINVFSSYFRPANLTIPPTLETWQVANIEWMRTNIAKEYQNDRYWFEAAAIFAQLDGLVAGYNAAAPATQQLTFLEMYLLNQDGDMEDLGFLIPDERINPTWQAHGDNFHCSSLVKLLPGNADLFVGHDTWDTYGSMLRVYKHYDFTFQTLGQRRVSFSSSFGWLSSIDDWYINHNNLVITETTNGFMDSSLHTLIVPYNVLSWVRCMIANYAASTGPDWHWYFSRYNSGTYNNQWIIVDMKLFTPGMPQLQPNTLTISEAIPGYFETADMTWFLNQHTYWASYNVPYFPDVYNRSGFPQPNGWATAPRALIFKRDHGNIKDFDSFQDMMNYNNYKTDPISNGSPSNAIAARGDLSPTFPSAFGAIDMKVTSSARAAQLQSIARCGPSQSNGRLPPFQWTSQFNGTIHVGQPVLFNFTAIPVQPYYSA